MLYINLKYISSFTVTITMEIKASNDYQPSNNFGFDSDMEEDYVDMKANSDPDVKSNSDSYNKSNSDPDIKSNSDPGIEANSNSITQDSNDTNINPWKVKNLKEFLRYHCPQCDFTCKEESEFYSHAVETHKQARIIFYKDSSITPNIQVIDQERGKNNI